MKIGDARVSTFGPNLNLQTDALERFGCEKIFTETASGANVSQARSERCDRFLTQRKIHFVFEN